MKPKNHIAQETQSAMEQWRLQENQKIADDCQTLEQLTQLLEALPLDERKKEQSKYEETEVEVIKKIHQILKQRTDEHKNKKDFKIDRKFHEHDERAQLINALKKLGTEPPKIILDEHKKFTAHITGDPEGLTEELEAFLDWAPTKHDITVIKNLPPKDKRKLGEFLADILKRDDGYGRCKEILTTQEDLYRKALQNIHMGITAERKQIGEKTFFLAFQTGD